MSNDRQQRGDNIEQPIELTLHEAYVGTIRTFNMQTNVVCPACQGAMRTGLLQSCTTCKGQGVVLNNKRIQVKIPAGVDNGSKIRVAGEGQPGVGGGPRGDLFLVISVRPNPNFERKDDDLYTDVNVEQVKAMQGSEIPVPIPDGRILILTIPPETPNGRTFRLAGKGMPRLNGEGNGHLYARIKVTQRMVEKDITKQQQATPVQSPPTPPVFEWPVDDETIVPPTYVKRPHILGHEKVKSNSEEGVRMNSRVGQQLSNYRLIRLLGQGGFAEVYLAEHIYLKTQVAVKVLHAHLAQDEFASFLHEAQTIARLRHPHIIPVFDFGIDGTPFLVMDYLPQGSLRQQHPRGSRVPLPTVVSYVNQIAAALQYAHDSKVIHRDVKPENMLVNSSNRIVLSDFGIATIAHQTASLKTVNTSGTPAYMAPEHIAGKPRPASDQYALGIVVYEWICGMPPFHGEPMSVMYQQTYTPVPPMREQVAKLSQDVKPSGWSSLTLIDKRIEQTVLTALDKNPQNRFESIQAFATAFEIQVFIVLIEKQILEHMIESLHEGTITKAQSQQCAKDFLALEPFKSTRDVLEGLKALGKIHKIAEQTYLDAVDGQEELMKRMMELEEKREQRKRERA